MGRALFPPCSLTWDQTMVKVMRIMATSFNKSHAPTATLNAPNPAQATADPRLCRRLLTLRGKSGPVSCGVTAPFSWVLVLTRFCLWPPRVCKLEVVKKEMARVNLDILGISKIKWIGTGEINPDDHQIYYCWQETLRRNGVAFIVNKRYWNAVLGCNLKNNRMISIHFQGKPFNITVIQVYATMRNAEEFEAEQFYEDLQDLLELTSKKDVLFIIGDWNEKVGIIGKFVLGVQNEAGQRLRVLPRECTGHSKHPLTTQEKSLHMDITRWSTQKSDWLYSLHPKMEKL